MLIAACSQMNAPSEQLQSMKGPQSAWSIWRDKDQSLRMLEFYLAAATVYFCPGGQFLKSPWAYLLMSFANFLI